MAAPQNLILQLLITAKDNATAAFGKLFSYLDDNTKVIAGKIREAFAGVFGGGLDGAADLEAQLDRVQAKGNYTAEALSQLKQAAQQLGAQFGISGVEAAQGMESLAAAGLTAQEAIATLPQVLALAKAEQISADAAATKLIDSLSIMGLGFEEAGRMADVLAKGADITTSSASQLAEALSEAGGVARAAGLDLESTVAALDLLHKNGIKGSEAGTALKGILTALLDPASQASTELTALGITSRDLGTVLGALQSRGDAASTAILAFGTEAGPGLRALINEGQQGLNDYTAQLQNAEGAALNASAQMGGNLKSALDTLNSAWDSLRSALLEPLLAPITAQVKDLAGAFQEGLSSDKFQAVQATIQAFGEQAAKAIGDFIRSFDFQAALTALANFVAGAKDHFTTLADAGSKAASVVVIAWNGVTAGMKTLGAAMTTLVASLVATLANIEDAAAKVGLGSVERATELRAKALEMQATARDLLRSIQTDAADMGAALDRLTTKAGTVKTALEDLKTAAEIPPDAAVLQPIIRSLEDYQTALEQAQTAQQDAAKAADEAEESWLTVGAAMDYGRATAYAYEEAVRKNQLAQAALKTANEQLTQASSDYTRAMQEARRATDAESAAAAASVQTKEQHIEESQRAVAAAQQYADAVADTAKAQLGALDAEIALAEAKGDTAEVQRLTIERAQLEADLGVKVAQAKWAEQQAEAALAIAKLEQLNAIQNKNAETQKQIELAVLVAQKELAEAEAAGVNAEAQEILAEKLREVNAAKAAATEATEENTEVTEENAKAVAEATKASGDEAEKTTKKVEAMNVTWAKFGDLMAIGFGLDGMRRFNLIIEDIQRAIDAANTTAQQLADEGLGSIAGNAATATIQVENMARALDESQSYLNDAARTASQNLRSALQQAREEAEGLAESIAGMAEDFRREILQIQGDQKTLLELDHQDNLAKLEELHQRAGQLSNDEYQHAVRQAEALHRLKLQQLAEQQAEAEASPSSSSTSASASPTASASKPAKTYELKLAGAGKALTAYTDTDPSAFLAAMEDAQRRSLA